MKAIEDMSYQELIAERSRAVEWFNAENESLQDHEEGNIERSEEDMRKYNKIILETTKRLQEFDAIPYYKRQNDE